MNQTPPTVLFPPLLLATDGSSSARLAQKLLYQIAQALQVEETANGKEALVAVTVQPRRSSRSNQLLRRIRRVPPSAQPEEAQKSTTVVEPASEGLSSEGRLFELLHTDFPVDYPISTQVRQGRPETEILNCARTIGAGLIAIGSRGTGGVRELLLGSVSTVISRYAPCSVLVARGSAPERSTPKLSHVLLAVNTTASTQSAILATRQLISAGIEQVTILYIQPLLNADYLFGPFAAPNPSWQLSQSLQTVQREQGEQALSAAKSSLNSPGLKIQTLLQTGEPGPLICQVAQQQQVDLVIVGSDPKRRSLLPSLPPLRRQRNQPEQPDASPVLRNARLGAVEDYTIHHAPCPVLLCRSPHAMTGSSVTK